ncbi:(2Fe-2S)-binding protein [Pacificimonas flava]|uniref:Carbon monoxide dehydrogenase small chain n=1 Tax=Pacificimonas flava TaxID=1234595 RepID=M2TPS1_9SPHN|nr:(2Fe-2S)-binding protein [Pacificimonas flava]EMD83761.1 Carbon monoxide dehydrogenase small chain [Pacificimonas flava]MBB5280557.1 carbon-monoxide dehydrogenase small subunit [Pacificimonas flava]
MAIEFTLNGERAAPTADPTALLVEVLRDELGLTGTHIGCDTSQCGACNVLMNGEPVKSCTLLLAQVDGADIVTIEGLAEGDTLHPMQLAFKEAHGLQCGFCTPGMVMAGIGIAKRHGGAVGEDTIAHELEGNLCRCTGYVNIVKAIKAGAAASAGEMA